VSEEALRKIQESVDEILALLRAQKTATCKRCYGVGIVSVGMNQVIPCPQCKPIFSPQAQS
jgi:hypothetical protein